MIEAGTIAGYGAGIHLKRVLDAVRQMEGRGGVPELVAGASSPGAGVDSVRALLDGVRDGSLGAAVLPAPDLPLRVDDGLAWQVVLPRGEVQTLVLSRRGEETPLMDRHAGQTVGVFTRRDRSLLGGLARQLTPISVESEVDGLDRLREGDLDALLVPGWIAATLDRSDLEEEALNRIIWPPRPGEGACVIVHRRDHGELTSLTESLIDPGTDGAVRAELAFAEAVEAPEDTVIIASALAYGPGLRLKGMLMDPHGSRAVHADRTGHVDAPEPLGWAVAADVVRQSAEVLT